MALSVHPDGPMRGFPPRSVLRESSSPSSGVWRTTPCWLARDRAQQQLARAERVCALAVGPHDVAARVDRDAETEAAREAEFGPDLPPAVIVHIELGQHREPEGRERLA